MLQPVLLFALLAFAFAGATTIQDEHRIVNGYPIDISKRPHQVSFQFDDFHFCGGTLIARNMVLTAAHCTWRFTGSVLGLTVRVGSSNKDDGGQVIEVERIIPHEGFDNSLNNDIAILILAENVVLGPRVQVAKLRKEPTYHDELLYVTGWGKLWEGGENPEILQETYVRAIDKKYCEDALGHMGPSMFCAGYMDGHSDACQGDSGGPLVDSINQLVGVVSWGNGCGLPNNPGVYTSVSLLYNWVQNYWQEFAQ